MKTIIHVNQAIIRRNLKRNENKPAIIVKTYKGSTNVREVEIHGITRVVQSKTPRSCGARVWIECDSDQVAYGDQIA